MYLLAADCLPVLNGGEANIKVYYTHPIKDFCGGPVVILPDGRIVVTGGIAYGDPMGNYNPSAKVFAFSPFDEMAAAARSGQWDWIIAALVCLLAGGWLIWHRKRTETTQQEEVTDDSAPSKKDLALYAQVCELMEGEQLYRQQGLTIADLASRLRSNTKYISNAIGAGAGCSFTEFLNGYRIREAEKLLLSRPDAHMNEISEAVGYANESSFFCNFRLVHGCSPQRWIEKNG